MGTEKITVNELFSGIGAQRKALERLGIDHEVVGVCEIDKYAIQSYEAIFGETYNYGDICTAERLEYADLWTYSFPCQDISVAGNQKGISSETRSGLLYQVQRLLEVAKDEGKLPKYLLLENVKNLVGKKFKSQFDDWLFYLDELGYDTYWQVLNAKHYGIPQNRERVFAISIRKDLNKTFEFSKPEELKIKLKDILEDEVEEKFYLSEKCIQGFLKHNENHNAKGTGFVWKPRVLEGYAACLRANSALCPTDNIIAVEPKIQQVKGNLYPNSGNPQAGRVYEPNGISPALDTCQGGNRMPKVITYSPYVNKKYEQFIEKNKYVPELFNPYNCQEIKELAPTLTAQGDSVTKSSTVLKTDGIRIRKLTPLECWRLMGFDDEDFYKAQKSGVSNSQLYKQAGNSIVVNVLEKIFKNLF